MGIRTEEDLLVGRADCLVCSNSFFFRSPSSTAKAVRSSVTDPISDSARRIAISNSKDDICGPTDCFKVSFVVLVTFGTDFAGFFNFQLSPF